VAGTATAVSNRVSQRQGERWAEQGRAGGGGAYAPMQQQAAAPPPAEDDSIAKLKELGELHQSGVLTDEEFAAQKAKILGS
jgi:hypothetical protein